MFYKIIAFGITLAIMSRAMRDNMLRDRRNDRDLTLEERLERLERENKELRDEIRRVDRSIPSEHPESYGPWE